jgi:hypothetical protein
LRHHEDATISARSIIPNEVNMPSVTIIDDEAAADLIAAMTITATQDTGPSVVHHGRHHQFGEIAVIANCSGDCFAIRAAGSQAKAA